MPYRVIWGPPKSRCIVNDLNARQAVDLIIGHKVNYRTDMRILTHQNKLLDFDELQTIARDEGMDRRPHFSASIDDEIGTLDEFQAKLLGLSR